MSKIQAVSAAMPRTSIFQVPAHEKQPVQGLSFGKHLKNAIQEVDQLQRVSDVQTKRLVTGQNVDLHDVMLTAQKATVALNATIEIRNKVVEAYQEISRMPL